MLLTEKDAAQLLGVSVDTVRRLRLAGEIPHYRIGRMIRYRESDLNAYIQKHMVIGRVEIPSTRYKPGDKLV